ncbi:sulfite exporter TauE/SafE family protein [Halonotius roseus]|uniref:Sulfite exporter TauE/SafE family protein n=1 Tax=Halonotius roseus TaxID=2511997 RepID=A0A544QMM6_9EURY|nr:sulfite exporter TauE/SafE family protein [Halonotius roseus]TQQ80169.1 sulfite exporter TauE/SafE family protein [Halonotius roseus]
MSLLLQHTVGVPGSASSLAGQPVSLGVFLLIGLFGGAHCLGMCGPLVTTYADRMREQSAESDRRPDSRLSVGMVKQHGLFNLGRAVSYALIGGLFGLAGSLVVVSASQVTTAIRELNIVVGFTIGVLIMAAGVSYLVRGQVISLPGESLVTPVTTAVQSRLMARVDDYVGGPQVALLGGIHGLLPCPLLYPAFLYAFAQAAPVRGALSLAALGLGTVPSLFLYGTLFQSVSVSTRVKLHRILGVGFLVLGYIPFQHALMLIGIELPHLPVPFYQPL